MRVRLIGALLLAAAGLQAWTHRFLIHPDGLSYIDVADAYARGDFQTAINPLWSPLQAWLYVPFIAAGLPRELEPAVFHLLNLPILLFAYAAFVYLMRSVVRDENAQVAALILFAWTQIHLMPLWHLGGDRLAAGFLFLALGLLLRGKYLAGGVAFGFGFLAKAVLLPLAVVTIPLLLLQRARRGTAIAFAGLFIVAAPWITILSLHEGKFTYSEAGRLNYLFDVNGVTRLYYQGDVAHGDSLLHPPRIVMESPRIYEFGTPFDVTYPIHYDLSYWYEGAEPRFDTARQVSVIVENTMSALYVARWLIVALLVLFLIAKTRHLQPHSIAVLWPALAGMGAYALRHIEPRYISPFLALVALGVLSHLELSRGRRTLVAAVAIGALLFAEPARRLALDALSLTGHDRRWAPYMNSPEVVRGLRAAGIRNGDEIATIGYDFYAHNARIVGARVVAEMDALGSVRFRTMAESERDSVYTRLRSVGIDAIVAADAPLNWRALGNSGLSIYLLR